MFICTVLLDLCSGLKALLSAFFPSVSVVSSLVRNKSVLASNYTSPNVTGEKKFSMELCSWRVPSTALLLRHGAKAPLKV